MRSPPACPARERRSTAPAWPRSSPRKDSGGCCAVPSRPRAPRRPPPDATPACPGPPGWTSPPGPPRWRPARPVYCCSSPSLSHSTCPPWSPRPATPAPASCPPCPGCCRCWRSSSPAPRRVSHVDHLLLADPAAALFAGLSTLPKKSALTDYSYRTSHEHQRHFLAALDTAMIHRGLATSSEAIFDLDFHAVMHWGHDPVLEKHYVPTRSQRARSVLTFFAQDSGTHNLVYTNADLAKATQVREVIAFCDHWNTVSGHDPHLLIMDQKVTTQPVLAELNDRGVKFLTLRMRSPALVHQIDALTGTDFTTITLNRPGRYNRPRVHESHTRLSNYPEPVRQLIITGLGRDAPTVIITNDDDLPAKTLIEHYARRMTIEQRLAEIIQAFHADALSSTVNLNVDLAT